MARYHSADVGFPACVRGDRSPYVRQEPRSEEPVKKKEKAEAAPSVPTPRTWNVADAQQYRRITGLPLTR
ncbi:MAG: hypothetical protein A3I05_06610 [Deltaproteobacteria bacterium RIFCSPLOWO2_02_FULL_44_10]|nr:MAG: hypothetical protein A3C46_06810 [Deltaproteobacteria bacterium RIFCSPHIGHO2_02_FULL_44_16]OGQ46703.1 MAG: hypothetical protein A3I05_06610 [Deltaproteobacteria bacterium RIFCSPLOWO2_02_FULL_44_10]